MNVDVDVDGMWTCGDPIGWEGEWGHSPDLPRVRSSFLHPAVLSRHRKILSQQAHHGGEENEGGCNHHLCNMDERKKDFDSDDANSDLK